MIRRLLLILALLVPALTFAQTVTITASNIKDASGRKLASGVICFSPVTNDGKPLAFQNAGQNTAAAVCRDVTTGVIQSTYKTVSLGTLVLADTTLTNPVNACYKAYVRDNATGAVVLGSPKTGGYDCVQPQTSNFWCTAGTCNFDSYIPNTIPGVVTSAGPTGPAGPTGATGPAGANGTAAPTVTNNAGLPGTSSDGSLFKLTDTHRGLAISLNNFIYPISTELNIRDFGARGDGGWYGGVGCFLNSPVIQFGTSGGRGPKVGDLAKISGCGAAGADMTCTIASVTGTTSGTFNCGGGVLGAATLTNRGARWGASIDDTPAFTAAMAACSITGQANGCRIRIPAGVYFVSNVTLPLIAAQQQGQIMFQGVGQRASWIIGIGADHSAIFQAPSGTVSSYFADLGFQNYDYKNASQIAVQWLGGLNHTFINNYVTNTYEMVNGRGIQNNLIAYNTCFTVIKHCVEFGASTGGDFVTATLTVFNNFQSWGNAGADSTAHAYYFHTGDASYSDTVAWNTTQFDNGTPGEPYDVNDLAGDYYMGYIEGSGIPSGYTAIFRGNGQVVHAAIFSCFQFTGTNQVLYGSSPSGNCPGQTYAIKNDATALLVYGMSSNALSSTSGNPGVSGLDNLFSGGALTTLITRPSTANDWPNGGRVDVTAVPMTKSNGSGANPDSPTQFGTSAIVPSGTVVFRPSPQLGFYTGHLGWLCNNSPCAVNPIVPSQWLRWGELYAKVHTENSGINLTAVAWQKGDGYFNTTPAPCSLTQPAYVAVTTAGSPGTHTALPLPCPTAVTASLGGGALAAGACTTGTATVTGATTSMVANASPVTYPGDTIYWKAYVSAADTVTVAVCSATGSTPTASVYNVRVIP